MVRFIFCLGDKIMKKLLALLLLSPLVFAEITNLKCDYHSTFNPSEMTNKDTGGNIAMTVNTEKKTVIAEGLTIPYRETGNEIWFEVYADTQKGDTYAWAKRYRLNRVSAELEQDFMTIRFPDGYTGEVDDLLKAMDLNNYDLGLVHSASCKKVESIF